MSDQIKLIRSYRKNDGTARRPVWGAWCWDLYCPIDSVDGIVSITQLYNRERNAFPNIEWKLEAGYLAPNGAMTQCEEV